MNWVLRRFLPGSQFHGAFELAGLRAAVQTVDGRAGDLAGAGDDVFLRLAKAVDVAAPAPLLIDDPAVNQYDYPIWHAAFSGKTADIGVYRLADAVFDGRGLIRRPDGAAMISRETVPAYWRAALELGSGEPLARTTRVKRLTRPAIAAMTPGIRSYGHWLLDILPRLWLARRALGDEAFAGHVVLVDDVAPRWATGLMQTAAGVQDSQIVRYNRNRTLLKAPSLIVPGTLHGDFLFHPIAAEVFDGLPDSGRTDLPRMFNVTRVQPALDPSHPDNRICINADALAARLAAKGVPSIEPSRLSWPDQIALFRRAELIVGEFGSALHNTIFSGAAARVVCLGFQNEVQSTISGFRGQRMAYVSAKIEKRNDGMQLQTFDEAAVEKALDAALAFKGG
jgi:capsular polysaccharide biosynthesis protein